MGLFDWVKPEDQDEVRQAWEEGQSGSVGGYSFDPMAGQYVAEDPGDYLVDPPGLWTVDGSPRPGDEPELEGWF